jgi:hypothetical protein
LTSPEPSTSSGDDEPPLNSWKIVRLAHHLRQHVEPAAMRHADDDLLHAERAAALDDLLQRRNHRLAAVEPEALGAGELQVAEPLEALGLDQLVEDRALALAGELDLLVAALDALLDPGLLRGIRDVHELDAERLAVGAAHDGEDLAQGRELEPEHLVEEDPTVEVGLGETVAARIELLLVLLGLEPERIEPGVEVAADAVGANEHQRVDRVARRLLHIGRGKLDAPSLRLGLDLVADGLLDLGPVAGQRRDQIAIGVQNRPPPRRATGVPEHVGPLVLQAFKERAPFGVDRRGVGLVAGLELFDIGGVAAIKK